MKIYLGKRELDVKLVGSVILELDDLDKQMIGSMSPRESLYGVSLVSKESDDTYRAVCHGKFEAGKPISFNEMRERFA